MLKVVHLIQHLPIHSYIMCSVFLFPGGKHVRALINPDTSMQNICAGKSIGS